MAQHDYIIANQSGAAFRSDLNNGLAAIVSQNSGAAQPSTTYAYQWWADTTTGLLKIRNAANNAWITVGTLASTNLGLLSQAGGTLTGTLTVLNQGNFSSLEIGSGTATNQSAYIDLVGDTTYSDYGLRIIRGNGGANATSLITQRGTGELSLQTTEAAPLTFYTTNIDRGRVDPSGRFLIGTNTASGSALLQVAGDAQIQSLNGGPLAGFRNRIINGNFDFWQRGTSFTGNEYGADRWVHGRVGTTHTATRQAFTLGQTAVPNEPTYFCRTVVSSVAGAGNYAFLSQKLEDARTFAGQQVTISFWAKADATKNIAVNMVQGFGTGGSPSANVGISATKVSIGTTFQKITVTATLPSISGKTLGTDNNSALDLNIWFDAGSTYNGDTDSLGQQSGTFDIAQVQIEPGLVATPFERRPIGTELALCQRYYEEVDGEFRHDGTLGGTNISVGHTWFATVPKRIAATVSVLSESGSNVSNILAVTTKGVNGAFCVWEYTSGTSIITRNKAAIIKFVAEL